MQASPLRRLTAFSSLEAQILYLDRRQKDCFTVLHVSPCVLQGAEEVIRSWAASLVEPSEAANPTAVLAALSFWDYAFVADVAGSDAYKATGRCISVAAGRISFTHDFKGNPMESLFQNKQSQAHANASVDPLGSSPACMLATPKLGHRFV